MKNIKHFAIICLLLAALLFVSACGAGTVTGGNATAAANATTAATTAAANAATTTEKTTTSVAETTTAAATTAAAAAAKDNINPDSPIVLSYATSNTSSLDTLKSVGDQLNKLYPNITVEIATLPDGVAGFNTAMAAKFAANDAPDIFTYQWGSQITQYARAGHLMDLTDTGISELIKPFDIPAHIFQGREYAYPLIQSVWGMLYNAELAASKGVDRIPKTYDEYIEDLTTLRDNGIDYPLIVPAKDGSGAIGFIQCWMPMYVVAKDPDYYYEILKNEKSFNGPEWHVMLEHYAELLEFASPDFLGLDPDNARSRFARGEGVYYQASSSTVKTIEELNPDLVGSIIYIPYPVFDTYEDYITCAQFDHATSIWSKSKYQDQALEYFKLLLEVNNAVEYSTAINVASSVLGTPAALADPSVVNQFELLEAGKYVEFFGRDWVTGMKEIMKTRIQEWMAGEDIDTALANLVDDHERLLEAAPEFMNDFLETRAFMGLPID